MQKENWKEVEKCPCQKHYKIKPIITNSSHSAVKFSFTHVAFDPDEEVLISVDLKGFIYLIDLSHEEATYRKLDFVGPCTFIEFNPINKKYILLGLESKDIRISKLDNFTDFCLLSSHTKPPRHASFYKDYCLTVSSREAIIWHLQSYSKAHQLKLGSKDMIVKKAAFSNLGLITVLFKNDLIQAWLFQKFDKDVKINLKKFGLQNVKDFTFTKDGKAMVVAGLQCHMVIFNTQNWEILKSISFNKNMPGINKLMTVSRPLDGGANNIVAILLSDCTVKFFNLTLETIVGNCHCQSFNMVKRILVSQSGRYLAHIGKDGELVVTLIQNVLSDKYVKEKTKESKVLAHKTEDHLQCVQQAVKEELKLQRLLPILKEFGEYPEKHRVLIWLTILKLPSNRKAYTGLSNRLPQITTIELMKNYSLADKGKATLLTTTMHCLIQWCSLLEHCTFLPGLVFPFIVVFQKNPLLAFETVLNIILNYCQKWWEYHPLPPLNILGIIENILLERDPTLLNVFCDRGITSTDYAWPLLQTTFSEVLPADEWLILWDHLLSYGRPSLFLMCVVAYNICSREIIISTLKSRENFQRYYTSQSHIGAKILLKVAHRLDREITRRIHPSQYIRDHIEAIPLSDVYPPLPHEEYPKILTEDLRIQNLKKLKEQELFLQARRHRAAKLMEEQRIRTESENFIKQIHKIRMDELRKCYEDQIREQVWSMEHTRKDAIWDASEEHKSLYRRCKKLPIEESESDSEETEELEKKKKANSEVCKKMQEQVRHLEYEVYNLLANLRSTGVKTKTTS